jgi:glutathione S-transferase
MAPLLMKLIFDRVETSPAPFFVKPIARGIAQKVKGSYILPQIAAPRLSGSGAGQDAVVCRQRIQRGRYPDELPAGSRLRAWRPGRIARTWPPSSNASTAVPAFQRALERGGPYELLKQVG